MHTYTSIKAFPNISANFRLYKNKKAYENTRILKKLRRCRKKIKNPHKKRIIERNNKYLFKKNNESWCRACNVKIVHEKNHL
jgi:hypothetical protein